MFRDRPKIPQSYPSDCYKHVSNGGNSAILAACKSCLLNRGIHKVNLGKEEETENGFWHALCD